MKRILVTGGSGRLGRYVVKALSDEFQLTVFDKKAPLFECASVVGDVLDRSAIAEVVRGQDAVIHLAALDLDFPATDAQFMHVNVEGTWNVFEACRNAGVSRIVHCSSEAAVGLGRTNPPQYLPIDVEHPADPTHAYGLTKLIGEKIARRFHKQGDMQVICLRPALILQPDYVYDVAVRTAQADGTPLPPALYQPNWQSFGKVVPGGRAFIDPRDAAAAFRAALLAEDVLWGVFFVANPYSYSGLPTCQVIEREYGVRPNLRDPNLFGEGSRACLFEIASTMEALGWRPLHNWPSVFAETLRSAQIPIGSAS